MTLITCKFRWILLRKIMILKDNFQMQQIRVNLQQKTMRTFTISFYFNLVQQQNVIQSKQRASDPMSHSNQSDTNVSKISVVDETEDELLPIGLKDDDLRYKLIYIYL